MRISILVSLLLVVFTGCSNKNAFDNLSISKSEELAMENTKSGKIALADKIDGIYTVVYLNSIYKNEFKGKHVFYISLYLKSDADQLRFTLNGMQPAAIKEMKKDNKYAKLLSTSSLWTNNYLVSFEDDKQGKLNFLIDSGQFSSGQLNYSKE